MQILVNGKMGNTDNLFNHSKRYGLSNYKSMKMGNRPEQLGTGAVLQHKVKQKSFISPFVAATQYEKRSK